MFGFFKKKPKVDERFSQPLSPEADTFLAAALKEYGEKEKALERNWRLSDCAEYALNDETGLFHMKLDDGSAWEADAQILGSFNEDDQGWQWAWGNPHCAEIWSRDSKIVRDTGKRLGIWYLHELPMHPVPGPEFVAYLCAIGLKASNSTGMFEAQDGSIVVFIMLKNLRWTTGKAHAAGAAQAKVREGESLTDGIRKINAGDDDVLGDWLEHFARSEVYAISIDKDQPQNLLVLGPKGEKNFIAVFTDKTAVKKAVGDRRDTLFPMKVNGKALLKKAQATGRGLIINPTDESAMMPLPPKMIAAILDAQT